MILPGGVGSTLQHGVTYLVSASKFFIDFILSKVASFDVPVQGSIIYEPSPPTLSRSAGWGCWLNYIPPLIPLTHTLLMTDLVTAE